MGVTAEMLLSSANPDHVMSRRVSVRMGEAAPVAGGTSGDPRVGGPRSQRSGWARAAAGSALVHAGLLSLLATLGSGPAPSPEAIVVEVLPPPPAPIADPAAREPSGVALPDPPLATEDEL